VRGEKGNAPLALIVNNVEVRLYLEMYREKRAKQMERGKRERERDRDVRYCPWWCTVRLASPDSVRCCQSGGRGTLVTHMLHHRARIGVARWNVSVLKKSSDQKVEKKKKKEKVLTAQTFNSQTHRSTPARLRPA